MDIEAAAWQSMHSQINAPRGRVIGSVSVRRIAGFLQPHRAHLVAFVVLVVAASAMTVVAPVLAGRVVDAIVSGAPPSVPMGLAALIAAAAVAEAVLGLMSRRLSAHIGESLVLGLRTRAFDHVQRMPVAFFTRTRTGALISRLNNDVTGAGQAFSVTLPEALGNFVVLVLTLVAMCALSWQITLVALVSFPLFLLPAKRFGARLAPLIHEADDHNAAMASRMAERFSGPGAILVKLLCRPADESATFAARARRVKDIEVRIANVQATFITAVTLVSALALAMVYGLGGYFAAHGGLEPGVVVALALLLSRLYAPLSALASARVAITGGLVSFARVFEVLDFAPLITEKPKARAVPEGPVSVEFDGVHFSYPPADRVSLASLEQVAKVDGTQNEPVLRNVSFRAEPGQTIAVVGSSGAGKSTLAQLVPRLYDVDDGAVRIGGVDVRDLTSDSLRDVVGMVTQDGHVFHDSVRANLLVARHDAAEAELWDALRRARLDGVVASLPVGLDTVIGERGYHLSGGERQRLTIARMLLAKPRVVILDEATAHLDSTSEEAVQAALQEALVGRTAIVIAHRLSTIRAADVILVVEDGRIVERGTHADLIAAGGRYHQLCVAQAAPVPALS